MTKFFEIHPSSQALPDEAERPEMGNDAEADPRPLINEPVSLTGSASSFTMSFAPEQAADDEAEVPAEHVGDPLPFRRAVFGAKAGTPHDPAEGVAFALWNEGRKDEAIDFLERQIARQREPDAPPVVPVAKKPRYRALGAGVLVLVAGVGVSALWTGWVQASRHFNVAAIVEPFAELGAVVRSFADVAEAETPSAVELAQIPSPSERGATDRTTEEVRTADDPVGDTLESESTIASVTFEEGSAEPAAPVEEREDLAPSATLAGIAVDESPVETVQREPEDVSSEVDHLVIGDIDAEDPALEISELPPQTPPAQVPMVEALAGDRHAAAAGPVPNGQASAPLPPLSPDDSVSPADDAGRTPLLVELAGRTDAVEPPADEMGAAFVADIRLPRPRPEHVPVIAAADRPTMFAAAQNRPRQTPPPAVAPPPPAPPAPTVYPEPYAQGAWDPQYLPPELAYNRALAERYAARRRAMAEWRPPEPVYVVPAPAGRPYGRLEIIGRVPGW